MGVLLIDGTRTFSYFTFGGDEMTVTASVLRKDIYHLLDQVLETGKPLAVQRKSGTLKIVADQPPTKMARLKKHDCIQGDPEELVHLDWSGEWKP